MNSGISEQRARSDSRLRINFDPWPVDALVEKIAEGDFLYALCKRKTPDEGRAVREHLLEARIAAALRSLQQATSVHVREQVCTTLNINSAEFPSKCMPDIVWKIDSSFHICEVKSNLISDSRAYAVVGKSLRHHLGLVGHAGRDPTEVEQDLIKLALFRKLSSSVGTCILLFVDAYGGKGLSWRKVFSDRTEFFRVMRTDHIRDNADAILSSTEILPVVTPQMSASVIVCKANFD